MDKVYKEAIAEIEALYDNISDLKILRKVAPPEITGHLAQKYDFRKPVNLSQLLRDVTEMLQKWNIQVTHPRYFGYFNPSVRPASIVGDMLTAAYNPQLAVWSHAPAAIEMEQHMLRYFLRQFGLDPVKSAAHFTSGGSEANFTAVISALTAKCPEYGDRGLKGISQRPVLYVSRAAHDSFGKICHMTGLGRDSLRKIETDRHFKMDIGRLEETIRRDIHQQIHRQDSQ